jgi:hypothetical protein
MATGCRWKCWFRPASDTRAASSSHCWSASWPKAVRRYTCSVTRDTALRASAAGSPNAPSRPSFRTAPTQRRRTHHRLPQAVPLRRHTLRQAPKMLPRHDQARLHQALSQKNRFVRHYLKPLDSIDPLPRPKGRCYSEKRTEQSFSASSEAFGRQRARSAQGDEQERCGAKLRPEGPCRRGYTEGAAKQGVGCVLPYRRCDFRW